MTTEEFTHQLALLQEKIKAVSRKINQLKKDNLALIEENIDLKKQLDRNKNANFVPEVQEQKEQSERYGESELVQNLRMELDEVIQDLNSTIDWIKLQ